MMPHPADLDDAYAHPGHFPGDDAALKLLYLALNHAADEWQRPQRQSGEAKSRFAVVFGKRVVI